MNHTTELWEDWKTKPTIDLSDTETADVKVLQSVSFEIFLPYFYIN